MKDRLFLFSFDLIDLNTFYNYFIYCLFIALDFVFIGYFPLNQIYEDFIVTRIDVAKSQLNNDSGNITLSTYNEELYVKSFDGESKDGLISSLV